MEVKYDFNKQAIEMMYKDTLDECFEALVNGTIDEVEFKIQMGNQVIKIPVHADNLETIFAALKECAEFDEEEN